MAMFDQFQHLLEQSLRDLHAGSNNRESAQEEELTQALQRLTVHLNGILAESNDSERSAEQMVSHTSSGVSSSDSLPQHSFHLMTSCDGVVLMANDAALELLGFDAHSIGTVSLAERIAYDDWKWMCQELKAFQPPQGSVSWIASMDLSGVSLQKILCCVTPMLDQSRKVIAWHWELHQPDVSPCSNPFGKFVQGFEAQLLNGHSLDSCFMKICDGFVQTFGYPFVWIATVQDGQPIQLRAQAVTADLDWGIHGPRWWESIARQDVFAQACVASEGSLVSLDNPYTGELTWFPTAFQIQEAYCVPLAGQGDISGILVVCSRIPKAFDPSIREWLEALGCEMEKVMARGIEMEQLRLHRAVMGSVQDAMCLTDPHGRVEWVNQAFTTVFGVTPHQVLGTPLRSFPHAQLQQFCPTLESSTRERGCVKTEVMEKGKDGVSLVFEQVLTPLVDAQGKTTHFVVTLHDVTARTVAAMRMKYQAYHDALTDLPNRVMFEDRLQLAIAQARRDGTMLAVFFLDLDNFKAINDQHGHQIGDRLLRVVAKRLMTCVRTTDTVSRLSGDEFTIVVQGVERIQDIRQVAQKIVDGLISPIQIGGKAISVQMSIGIAVYPKDSTDPRRLLAIADHAMYRAKDSGGRRWHFATSEWNIE